MNNVALREFRSLRSVGQRLAVISVREKPLISTAETTEPLEWDTLPAHFMAITLADSEEPPQGYTASGQTSVDRCRWRG
tara:strand:- start:7601 stop:7837 length:237 start_codon:yes stop_codon:yes gene_type:complete